ncbi:MAG: phosphohistidine phosphatase SixA [Deltaproteobacteria bacterium]|nr:phosphohistidine phosphatase SixA [Deltaproteobacteria bacterium]
MKLYLMRHGEAEDGNIEPTRPLTDRGRTEVERVGRYLKEEGVSPKRIVHSQKLRARETAGLISTALSIEAEEVEDLLPLDSPEIWRERLLSETGDMMLVGHMPYMGMMVSLLTTGSLNRAPVVFSEATVICLERKDDGNFKVLFRVDAEEL